MSNADRSEREERSTDPALASFVAIVRKLATQLSHADEPGQYVEILERGGKSEGDHG